MCGVCVGRQQRDNNETSKIERALVLVVVLLVTVLGTVVVVVVATVVTVLSAEY